MGVSRLALCRRDRTGLLSYASTLLLMDSSDRVIHEAYFSISGFLFAVAGFDAVDSSHRRCLSEL